MTFLEEFFSGTTFNIELRTVPAVSRLFTRDQKAIDKFLKDNLQTHIYFGCCTREGDTKGDKSHCREIVALWADLDFSLTPKEEADAAIADFAFRPSIKINSGGGYHVYWLLNEPIDAHDKRCEPTLRGVTAALRADPSGAELARILRVPNTLNHKYKPSRKVEIISCDWDCRYNIDDFEMFIIPESSSRPIEQREGKIKTGARTAALVSLAGIMNRKGNTQEEAEAACLGLNTRFDPPHTEKHVKEKVNSIYQRYEKQHGDIGSAVGTSIEILSGDKVNPEPLTWLWENRIPLGKLTVFCGVPDTGKSTVSIDIAARCTTGKPWPDVEASKREPCEVLMLISEDDLADTVIPRLMAAQADLEKIHFAIQTKITDNKSGNQKIRRIALDQDLGILESTLAERPEIKLIIADPLGSYLGKLKRNAEEDIRWVLTELKEMAERTKIAIISIDHFNKNGDQSAIHRLSGAGALAAVPRAVWGFVKDKDDPEKLTRLMLNAKLNVVSEAKKAGLKYRAVGVEFSIKNVLSSLPVISWMGASAGDLDEILREKPDQEKGKVDQCAKWLRERLEKNGGTEFCSVIYEEAEKLHWNSKAVQRSVSRANAVYDKIGNRSLYKLVTTNESGEL